MLIVEVHRDLPLATMSVTGSPDVADDKRLRNQIKGICVMIVHRLCHNKLHHLYQFLTRF